MITSVAATAPTQFLDIGGSRFAYRRFGNPAHRCAVRPHHQALRQDRARADVYVTQHHRGAGYLGLGFVSEKLVEARGGLTYTGPRYPGPGRAWVRGVAFARRAASPGPANPA